MACISLDKEYSEFNKLVVENERIKITVFPELGAKIYDIIDKENDVNFLWHNLRVRPRHTHYGQNFDDVWCGGWDEILPTVDSCEYRGDKLPYMGELWFKLWDFRVLSAQSEEVCLYTSTYTSILPFYFERWIYLKDNDSYVHLHYKITNKGPKTVDFLWGIHPALNISVSHRIDVPGKRCLVGFSSSPEMGFVGQFYKWPFLHLRNNGSRDMRIIPETNPNLAGGHYITELEEGWFSLTDTKKKLGIGFIFPTDLLKVIWVWMMYGGWRGFYGIVPEPWTGYPNILSEAIKKGRQRILEPDSSLECDVYCLIYSRVRSVSRIVKKSDGFKVIG